MANLERGPQEPKPLLIRPAGPTEKRWGHHGTNGGATCEVCGTEWQEGTDVLLNEFWGRQMVEECCGKLLDDLYEQFGDDFTMAFLNEFSQNPFDPKFGLLRFNLANILERAEKKAKELSEEVLKANEAGKRLKAVVSKKKE